MTKKGRTLRIVALAAGIPLFVLVLLVVGVIYTFGGFRENVAQDALKPITQSLGAAGGRQLCDSGDAGYGPDNQQPWYKVFYSVPDAASARNAFFAAAAANGYALKVDTLVSDQTDHQRFYASRINDDQLGLSLVIHRDATVTFDCSSSWGTKMKTGGTSAIYEIEFVSSER